MNRNTLWGIGVLSVVLLIIALVGARAITHRNDRAHSISVKGGAEADIESDLIVWRLTIESKSISPLEGLRDVERQQQAVQRFLDQSGITSDEILYGAVEYRERTSGYYNRDEDRYIEEHLGYLVHQTVTITSHDLDKIEEATRNVGQLIEMDVTATSMSPLYYYTELSGLKLELLAAATEDARNRAQIIAKESQSKLGGLKESRMGVFQIVGKNSNEGYSWGGNYNTSSRQKSITITVSSEFYIK